MPPLHAPLHRCRWCSQYYPTDTPPRRRPHPHPPRPPSRRSARRRRRAAGHAMVRTVSSPSAPVRTSPVPGGMTKASARGRGAALRSAVLVLALLRIRCIDDADDAAVSDTCAAATARFRGSEGEEAYFLSLDELAHILINEYHLNGSKSTFIKNNALAHIVSLQSGTVGCRCYHPEGC
ncbi:hypothetical protein B0H14DRAFT_655578 [Mycena olivaceomarginata]|nr:hypothetical protein B0H14DRAFT_655578 [Mycena olivaceomarginata]